MDRFIIKKPRVESQGELTSKSDSNKSTSFSAITSNEESCSSSLNQNLQSSLNKIRRKFQTNWLCKYTWLEYNSESDKALCSICKQAYSQNMLLFSTKKDSFLIKGFSNWKKGVEKFLAHEKSQCHKEAVMKTVSATNVNVLSQLQNKCQMEMIEAREALMVVFSTIKFLTRQGLAIRGKNDNDSNFKQCLEM